MKFKYHLTKRQDLLLGLAGSILVALFGPNATVDLVSRSNGHVDIAVIVPVVIGVIAHVLHGAQAPASQPTTDQAVKDLVTQIYNDLQKEKVS